MKELNKKFIKNIPSNELLKLYGEELIALFDYSNKKNFSIQAKAIAKNFLEQLVICIKD